MNYKMVDEMIESLEKLQVPPKHRFTSIEVILMAYFWYWTIIIALPNSSFATYSIYDDLAKIVTERGLMLIMCFMAIILFIGCITGIKKLRLIALILSMMVWSMIALSFMQVNLGSMRGSVIVLAGASAYQFICITKQGRIRKC